MTQIIHLAVNNPNPNGRGCASCRWLEKNSWPRIPSLDHCGKFQSNASQARLDDDECGVDASGWERKPPRLGLFPWIYRLFFGEAP